MVEDASALVLRPVDGDVARRTAARRKTPVHLAASGHDPAGCVANELSTDGEDTISVGLVCYQAVVSGDFAPVYPGRVEVDVGQGSGTLVWVNVTAGAVATVKRSVYAREVYEGR